MRSYLAGLDAAELIALLVGAILCVAALATEDGPQPPPPPSMEHRAAAPGVLVE